MPSNQEEPFLTARFHDALVFAARLHAGQNRKQTRVPYIAHLLGVTALVLEDGGDEDQAVAALLHDAVEDQGGLKTLEEIRSRFGDRVATIVDACTDTYQTPKPPWQQRKEQYIERLRHEPPEVLRVSLADKLHNARTILADLHKEGEQIWSRFKGGKEGTLWYYRTLVDVFHDRSNSFMAGELVRVVAEIERLSGEAGV
ncbi:MAG: HD domain-containing protein [Chloroflexota bacterium]|nr:MAG: HD domain-containing protein [Chloroflexota bacterium]